MNDIHKYIRKKILQLRKVSFYNGNYASWQEASLRSLGYQSKKIIHAVYAATDKVQQGKAAFERDGVAFAKAEYNWPIMAGIVSGAALNKGRLNVIDFGGSLGSTYWQHNILLNQLTTDITWQVVEQLHFANLGKTNFTNHQLSFISNLDDSQGNPHNQIFFASSSLPYIEDPIGLVKEVIARDYSLVILDRMPMIDTINNRLTIQTVPGYPYTASYPAWFFSHQKLVQILSKSYNILAEFQSLVGRSGIISPDNEPFKIKGFIMKRR